MRRRAFTLIELLVVVGIIALLIAILIPSLTAARERGKNVSCLAKLHAYGTALGAYTSDWGDTLPTVYYWPQPLLIYIAQRADPNDSTQAPVEYFKFQRCPAATLTITNPKAVLYGGNVNAFSGSGSPTDPYVKMASISRQSEVIAIGDVNQAWADGGGWWVFDWTSGDLTSAKFGMTAPLTGDMIVPPGIGNQDSTGPTVSASSLRYRHGSVFSTTAGTGNVLFFDMHSEGIKMGTLQVRNIMLKGF